MGLLYFLMPLMVWLALREQKNPSVNLWCAGGEIFGLGMLLMTLRNHAPEWLTYDVAALLSFAGSLLRIQGLKRELGTPMGAGRLSTVVGAIWLGYEAGRVISPYGSIHYIWSTSSLAGLSLWVAWLSHLLAKKEQIDSARWISNAYLPLAVVMLLHVVQVVDGDAMPGVLNDDYLPMLIALMGILSAVLGNTSFLGVFVERGSRQQVQAARDLARHQEGARLGRQITLLDRQRGMGLLAASLAHELSQPLTNIHLIAERASLDTPPDKQSVLSKYIDDILRNTWNAMEIMKRIRGFIRAKDVEFRPVNLHDVCTHVTSLMGDWLHSEGVDLQVSADGQPLNVQGDAVQLAQILVNLLRNATQATAGQARRQIRIFLQSEGDQVTVRVQDNGPGFSAEVLGRKAATWYTTKSDGLGVGLSISQHITEQHHGTLHLGNAPEGGAQVTLCLPAATTPTESPDGTD